MMATEDWLKCYKISGNLRQQTILAKVLGFICLLSFSSYMFIRNSIFCFTWNNNLYCEIVRCKVIRSAKAWVKKSPSGCLWQGQAGPPTGRGSSQKPGERKYNLWLFWLTYCTLGKSVAMVCSSRPYRRSEQTATHSSPVIATFGDIQSWASSFSFFSWVSFHITHHSTTVVTENRHCAPSMDLKCSVLEMT